MDTVEALKNRIYALKEEAYEKLILLPFYNEETQLIIKRCFKNNEYLAPYFYGGYSDSEYQRVIISSEEPALSDFGIATLKIEVLGDKPINHRMILGSILALGLKREVIGDIIYDTNYYYVFVVASLKEFIISNLSKIGPNNVLLSEYLEPITFQKEYAESKIFIASMRLDNVLAGAYNLGRSAAQKMIQDGLVKVNHEVVLRDSKLLKEGDLLSVRGKGRVILVKLMGHTKSNNLILAIKKPI